MQPRTAGPGAALQSSGAFVHTPATFSSQVLPAQYRPRYALHALAGSLGFAEANHFTRFFRQNLGIHNDRGLLAYARQWGLDVQTAAAE